jgi:hypothetical protein
MHTQYVKPLVFWLSRVVAVLGCAASAAMACSGGSKNSLGSGTDGGNDDGGPPPCSLPLSASAYSANLETLGTRLDALVTGFEHDHAANGTTIPCAAPGSSGEATYDWGNYAWIKLARGTDATGAALALSALKCMFTYQDLTVGSPTYGCSEAS